jgi:hypothetical protein
MRDCGVVATTSEHHAGDMGSNPTSGKITTCQKSQQKF